MEASLLFRTMVENDLDRILTCLQTPSVNTTTPDRFVEYLKSGSYRPEWTWLALDGDEIAGLTVLWGFPSGDRPLALDCLYAAPSVADPVALWTELIRHAPPRIEYHLFTEPGWQDDPEITARLTAASAAGLTTLTERLRYEWNAPDPLPPRSTRVRFAAEPDDEAFIEVFRRISEGSLDVATREGVARAGARAYAEEDVADYKLMPGPRDRWRLAYDADGELIGCALPSANSGGPVVGYLGVVPEHRGNGYVDDLLAEITWLLAGSGALRIRADTDTTNKPMAAAFERAGYRVFAIRVVAS